MEALAALALLEEAEAGVQVGDTTKSEAVCDITPKASNRPLRPQISLRSK